jgi:hypothetical protein
MPFAHEALEYGKKEGELFNRREQGAQRKDREFLKIRKLGTEEPPSPGFGASRRIPVPAFLPS